MSMAEQIELSRQPVCTAHHPALLAWSQLRTMPVDPPKISVLKTRFKSTIYRIENLGPGGSSLVAKYCRREVAAHERIIYEQILPNLPVSSPRYYGFVEGQGDYDWLFLEYIDGEQYSRERQDHSALAGRWLGLLHSSGERAAATPLLPDLGPEHFFGQLRTARARLQGNFEHLNPPQEDLAVIETVIQQCNFLESHWDRIERSCHQMPRTLVHGDFKPRNVVIRTSRDGPALFPFDWEASGCGVPAADLAYIDLIAYHEVIKCRWPGIKMQDLLAMKILGRIFRGLSEFFWESVKFDPNWEVSAVKLHYYQTRMAEAIGLADWRK